MNNNIKLGINDCYDIKMQYKVYRLNNSKQCQISVNLKLNLTDKL